MATDDTTATEARPGGSAAGRPAAEVARDLGVEPEQGLSADEAARRLAEHGPNQLAGGKKE
ncbi:hypothetical protein EKO23_17465, partial [Nocardioides guangzhouensis]